MSTELALDLRLARRKAGYTQRDVAHLMGVRQSLMSSLERGHRPPTIEQIVTLSLIYGRSFESYFGEVMRAARAHLQNRSRRMPTGVRQCVRTANRSASLERLARRLEEATAEHEGA